MSPQYEFLLGTLFWVIFLGCLLAFFYPWRFESRRSRVLVHLPPLLVVLFIAYEMLPMPGVNIRIDLLLIFPIGLALVLYLVKLVKLHKK